MFLISSCKTIEIHDTKVCAVAGVLSAGVSCTKVISGVETEMTFEELVEMLEPTEERGGAVVIPLKDFIEMKGSLEEACVELKCKKKLEAQMKMNMESFLRIVTPPKPIEQPQLY